MSRTTFYNINLNDIAKVIERFTYIETFWLVMNIDMLLFFSYFV